MALHAFAATSAVPALSPESGAFCPACKKIRQNVKGFFRRTSFAPLPAARRDGAQPAAVGPRPVPRSQHSEFTQELQRFATRRVFPPAAARRDGARSAVVGSRPVPRSQHLGFTQKLQKFTTRPFAPQPLRARTARGPHSPYPFAAMSRRKCAPSKWIWLTPAYAAACAVFKSLPKAVTPRTRPPLVAIRPSCKAVPA